MASARVHSDRFDEKAAYLIATGRMIIRVSNVDLALNCIPVLQIALHI